MTFSTPFRAPCLFAAAFAVLVSVCAPAHARATEKYEAVDLKLLVEYITRSKLIELKERTELMDYLATTECEIYKTVKDSQFKQQEIQHAIMKKLDTPIPGDGILYLKVPSIFYISEYNFDTQSMTLAPESQMKKANILDIWSSYRNVCEGISSSTLSIPTIYNLRLNVPVSLYRIPLKKDIAETIYNRMDRLSYGKNQSVVYGMLYVQIEPVPPVVDVSFNTKRALMRGQLNMIELYLDPQYKVLLRQLDFDGNF